MTKFWRKHRFIKISVLLPVILIGILGFGDNDDTAYYPVILKRADMENSIKYFEPRDIEKPGKIYIIDTLIFISDTYKGIHIINNADSIHPKNIGFINIPGCLDMAIRGKYMYVDNAVDLVTIDLSVLPAISVTSRNIDVFPEIPNPELGIVPYAYSKEKRPANTVIVNWIKRDTNY